MQTESETSIAQNARPLATQPLGRLMRRYAVPCMTSLVVAALYNMVDQVFIANAPDLGSVGNAATTVVFPLTVAALAIAVMLGDGCCAFVSLMLGAGKQEDAHRAVGGTVTVSVLAGLVLMAAYLLFPDTLLTWFGGRVNAGTFEKAQEYFFWIAVGVPLYVFGQAMNPVIRSDGSPTFAMIATLAGAAANLVLDPLLIFVYHFGMAGAAIATVAGQALTAGLSIWYLTRMKQIHLQKDSFRPRAHLLGKCAKLGMTSFLAQISLVAAMAATNTMLRICSAQDAVFSQEEFSAIPMAVFGIVMKVFQIVISCAIGLAAGCIPVAGYNMGAGTVRPCERAFDAAAGGRSNRRADCAACGGAAARSGDAALRRAERVHPLHALCPALLPGVPEHDCAGVHQQRDVHLPAIAGESGCLDAFVDGAGDCVRRGAGAAPAAVFPAGRGDLFHACRRCADGNSLSGRAGTDIPLTGNGEVSNTEKPGRILRNRGGSTRLCF